MRKKLIIAAIIAVFVFFYFDRTKTIENMETNVQIGVDFLAKNAQQAGVKTTDSGLQYKVLTRGTGTVHPTAESNVTVNYHGTFIDGTVFDSSVDRGESISFVLSQTIQGWKEGVPLMVKGDKYRFYIPSNLAYKDVDVANISAGTLLIFDVELLSIN